MSQNKKLTIGLFGFGVVGAGLYQVLAQTPALQAEIKRICIKHPEKKREAPQDLFTTDAATVLNDPEINTIVEVIDDADAAFNIAQVAFKNGKALVSANKKMIADHLPELLKLHKQSGQPFLYESAVCASIPVIRNLEEYYDNELLNSLQAVVNGSTNYILSKMENEALSFPDAVKQAQALGFAESDPALDVQGVDAANKLVIILLHAYGIITSVDRILFTGIENIGREDILFAREKNWKIKLVAAARKLDNDRIVTFLLPQFIAPNHPIAFVTSEYNGVIIESAFADKQFFYGKGAGSLPTAAALLSDISALKYDYRYEYKKLFRAKINQHHDDYYLNAYIRFHNLADVPVDDFEIIKEWHLVANGGYLTGVISAQKLKQGTWWRQEGISLILLPDAIATEQESKKKTAEKVLVPASLA